VPANHSRERRVAFNQPALDSYVSNLEKMHELLMGAGAAMAVVASPAVLREDLIGMFDVPTPPTIDDVGDAYDRYLNADRDFAAKHPDVILIDAAHGFEQLPAEQRVRSFVDSIHLSVEGNDLMARVVARTLRERGIVP
jgi:hypothetical protein